MDRQPSQNTHTAFRISNIHYAIILIILECAQF